MNGWAISMRQFLRWRADNKNNKGYPIINKLLRSVNSSIDPWVFYVSLALTASFVAWGILGTDNLAAVTGASLSFVLDRFGWAYVLSTFAFVVFMFYLAFGRFGKIRLCPPGEKPEFSTKSWIAMMFSAGMGIGLMFYGVAGPMSHFTNPPFGLAEAGTDEAARVAMQYAVFHWALQPWAIYALFGLAIAWSSFCKGRGNLVSGTFRPLLGRHVDGSLGRTIEILAILATLFGTATSLGLGALQINGGLTYLWGAPDSLSLVVCIIAIITLMFIISAVTGVHRGIEWLSNTNMVLAAVLALFIFVVGPTVFIMDTFVRSIGGYFQNFLTMSFRTGAFEGKEWLGTWTIFYWAWWISWAPFVGTFVARISRGRTIREFVIGVLVAPSIICLVWFAIFGGTALHVELTGDADLVLASGNDIAMALFALLDSLPWPIISSVLAVVLIVLFFVSGADAASVVMAMLSSRGNLHPRSWVIVLWGVLTGVAAAVLLLAGGLNGLKTGAILAAGPFMVVLIGMAISLLKELREESPKRPRE